MHLANNQDRRSRLGRNAYAALHMAVLQRDAWSCQICGAGTNLEVHHLQYRSQQGSDSETNLITLCHNCHRSIHQITTTPKAKLGARIGRLADEDGAAESRGSDLLGIGA